MNLPFVAGDAWAVAQGQAASWTHFGYAAFCLDFVIASPLNGPASRAGDTSNGTINAPPCAAGTGTVEVLGDRLPVPPKTTQLGHPSQGEVVRRTGPRLWLVEAAAAS